MPFSAPDTSGRQQTAAQWLRTHSLVGAVTLICMIVVGVVWLQLRSLAHADVERQLDRVGSEITRAIEAELNRCEQMLELTRGFYEASEQIDRNEWAWFVHSTGIDESRDGLVGLAYVELVPSRVQQIFVADMRSQVGADFRIWNSRFAPPGWDPDARYVVKFHEPASRNRVAWGLDVSSSPINRKVYDDAATTGDAMMSGFMPLVQSDMDERIGEVGAVICLPVHYTSVGHARTYRDKSRLRGWVALAIDIETLIAGVWDESWSDLGIELSALGYDDQPVLGFSSRFEEVSSDTRSRVRRVEFTPLGSRMILRWKPIDGWSTHPDMTRANLTLLVGLILAGSLISMVWNLSRTRRRAVRMAREMTVTLRESERNQRELAVQADRANLAKSMFLANMSHEIRTPMTAILGYVDLLGDRTAEISTDDAVHAIRRAGNHLLRIINDVLDLSKIEAGHVTIQRETIPLGALLNEIIASLEPSAARKNLGLTLEPAGEVPNTVLTDAHRVRQILINLIGNAIKFTEHGSVHVRVAHDGRRLNVTVRDTGIGIEPEQLERIFSPFEQADNSVSRSHEGTGLGLAISRRLAEMLGGTISAESAPGIGSVFTLDIECKPAPDTAWSGTLEQRDTEDAAPEPAAGSLSGRVLLAEDGADNQRLITHFLTKAGLEVDVVSNGREILERFDTDPNYDLLITDMQMPVMDGYTATSCLRASGHTLPILALTAHAMAGDRERCIEAGCDEYQAKPINRASLINTVGRLLQERRAQADRSRAA